MIVRAKSLEGSARGLRPLIPIVAALGVALTAACGEEPVGTVLDQDPFAGIDADFIQYDYESAITQAGVRQAWVDADSAFGWEDSTAVMLFGVELVIYNDAGAEAVRVTSLSARLDAETQDMIARGNATMVVYGQETRIQSEVLEYLPEAGEIVSDTITRAIVRGEQLDGTCLRTDTEFLNTTVCDPVGYFPPLEPDTSGGLPVGAPSRARVPGSDPGRVGRDR